MQKSQKIFDFLIERKLADEQTLQVWIDAGKCDSKLTHSQSDKLIIELSYTVNILITDTNSDQITLFAALVWWLNVYQPTRDKTAFTFEVDPKNKTTADVFIQLPLSEKFKSKTNADGTTELIPCNPPVIFEGESITADLWIKEQGQPPIKALTTDSNGNAQIPTD